MKNTLTLLLVLLVSLAQAQTKKYPLLIGTYTNTCDSKGIYVYDFDTNTGDFVFKNATEKVINPSYLTLSKDQKIVYSVNENGAESTVSSFQFDAVSKRIILSDSHPLFNARFAILHSSFNGLTVRSVVNLIPSLLSFDEVSFSENAFNISEMQLVGDDIYSIVVKMF